MRYGPKEMQARGIPWLGCVRVWDEVAVILASLIGPTRGELLGCAHGAVRFTSALRCLRWMCVFNLYHL